MQRPTTYIGDIQFQTLLSNAGIARPLAEIRAIIMRDIWRLDFVSPSVTMNEILGKDVERTFPDQAGAKQFFEQFLALWNALSEHQDEKQPFRLSPFPAPKTTATLVAKLRGRISEIKCLLPLFDIDAAKHPSLETILSETSQNIRGFLQDFESKVEAIESNGKWPNKRVASFAALLHTSDETLEIAFNRVARRLAAERQAMVEAVQQHSSFVESHRHIGRNDPCPCGSENKFKKCCLKGPSLSLVPASH